MDFWDTAAAVKELSRNPIHPNHPMYLLPGNTTTRFNPYTLFWGIFKRITNTGIFTTMGIAGFVNYIIFILGLYFFLSRKFKSRSLPTYAFLAMLLIWGIGYRHANAYHLNLFLITLPYIGFFAFGLSFNALFFLSRYNEEKRKLDLFLYSLLAVIAFITHPLTGAFCFAAATAILLTERNLKSLLIIPIVPLLALVISFTWPYFSYWSLFTQNSNPPLRKSPLFFNQIQALGPALIGLPIIFLFALKKRHQFIVYGLLFCSLIYLISGVGSIFVGARFILFSAFFLHLAIAVYVEERGIFSPQKIRDSFRSNGLVIILIFILLFPSGYYRAREMGRHILRFFDKPFHIHSYNSPVNSYLFLDKHLSFPDVVIANAWREGWVIPAVTGAKIVETRSRSTFLMKDESLNRKKDVAAFFKDELSLKDRISIITKYDVTHILVNLKDKDDWHPSFLENLGVLGKQITRKNTIVLYRIDNMEHLKHLQRDEATVP